MVSKAGNAELQKELLDNGEEWELAPSLQVNAYNIHCT